MTQTLLQIDGGNSNDGTQPVAMAFGSPFMPAAAPVGAPAATVSNITDLLNALGTGTTDITIQGTITVTSTSGSIKIGTGVTIRGENSSVMIQRGEGYTGALIEVGAGGDLLLENITLDGNMNNAVVKTQSNESLLKVKGSSSGAAKVVLGSGAVLQNNNASKGTDSEGGGGAIVQAYGTLTMNSGSRITSNRTSGSIGSYDGGAVMIYGGTMIMNDGALIDNNIAQKNAGGVLVGGGGSFTMNGGSITNNRAANDSVGLDGAASGINPLVSGGGGGVAISGGTFNFHGGSISYNTAREGGGINSSTVKGGSLNMTGGTIDNNAVTWTGGGIHLNGAEDVTNHSIKGGVISNNKAAQGGGGIAVTDIKVGNNGATLNITNAQIINNKGGISGVGASANVGGGGILVAGIQGTSANTVIVGANTNIAGNTSDPGSTVANSSDGSVLGGGYLEVKSGAFADAANFGDDTTVSGTTLIIDASVKPYVAPKPVTPGNQVASTRTRGNGGTTFDEYGAPLGLGLSAITPEKRFPAILTGDIPGTDVRLILIRLENEARKNDASFIDAFEMKLEGTNATSFSSPLTVRIQMGEDYVGKTIVVEKTVNGVVTDSRVPVDASGFITFTIDALGTFVLLDASLI